MARRHAIAAIVALALGCDGGAPPGGGAGPRPISSAKSAADSGAADSGTTGSGSDSGAGPDREGDEEEPSESSLERLQIARPPRIVEEEVEVERPEHPRPAAGAIVRVPAGTLLLGSAPDDRLREDYSENDHVATEITAFEIDALPYPNDPDRPFLTGVTRPEAEQLCAEQGKRLCTEVEWEWACRGPDNRRYPSGNRYEPSDYEEGDPIAPASPFGAFGMGRLLEWTASAWGREADQVDRVAIRGYLPGALSGGQEVSAERGRRCAKRWHRQPETAQPGLGFRCCRGDENRGACHIEGTRPPFSLYNNMKPDKFASVIRSIPELAPVHDNPHMFSDADVRAVLARRSSDREELARQGIHMRWKPIRWIPRQGTELWVAVGRSNRHSFVVALHEIEDNEVYTHASSLVLWGQPIPLALVYRRGHRDELYWAPCWGCRDGGSIAWSDEENEAIVTHKW